MLTATTAAGLTLMVAAALIYAPAFTARRGTHNGQTPGHQLMGIRVIRAGVDPALGFGTAFGREFVVKGLLFGTLGALLLHIPTLANYLWPLSRTERYTIASATPAWSRPRSCPNRRRATTSAD